MNEHTQSMLRTMRKRTTWILLAIALAVMVWLWRQVWQHNLDRALVDAIRRHDTPAAIALLERGADANVTDRSASPRPLLHLFVDFWNKIGGIGPGETQFYTPAPVLWIAEREGNVGLFQA